METYPANCFKFVIDHAKPEIPFLVTMPCMWEITESKQLQYDGERMKWWSPLDMTDAYVNALAGIAAEILLGPERIAAFIIAFIAATGPKKKQGADTPVRLGEEMRAASCFMGFRRLGG